MVHAERNKVRAAYNWAERLAEPRKMMQVWADYLDGLRGGSPKVALLRMRLRSPSRIALLTR